MADAQEIENLMSLHAFQNKRRLTPGAADYRETVALKTAGVCYGRDGEFVYDDEAQKALHGLTGPTVGQEDTLNMHMLTTALLHVAGDGQTAKGAWYSMGYLTEVVHLLTTAHIQVAGDIACGLVAKRRRSQPGTLAASGGNVAPVPTSRRRAAAPSPAASRPSGYATHIVPLPTSRRQDATRANWGRVSVAGPTQCNYR